MTKVGIPRALLYYQYYPQWKTFFEELGAEVVVSPTTTQAMVSSGASRVVADTCLPAKVFLGHMLTLVDKCDFVFIPTIRSIKMKTYNCSKFLGLPDMSRAVIPESPPILDIEIDVNKGKRALYLAIYKLGRYFTWKPCKIEKAVLAALQAHLDYLNLMSSQGLTPPQAIEKIDGTTQAKTEGSTLQPSLNGTTIAVVGHPYILYDEHISYRIIHRLKKAGIRVLTPEMLTREELETAVVRLTGRVYWTYEEEVVGAGAHYLQDGVDGVIGITTFGCGPDSLMIDMVRRQATRNKTTPFMSLNLEEHTAEGGLMTRIEAFIDMVQRRNRNWAERK